MINQPKLTFSKTYCLWTPFLTKCSECDISVFKIIDKTMYHYLRRAQRFCYANLWQIVTRNMRGRRTSSPWLGYPIACDLASSSLQTRHGGFPLVQHNTWAETGASYWLTATLYLLDYMPVTQHNCIATADRAVLVLVKEFWWDQRTRPFQNG